MHEMQEEELGPTGKITYQFSAKGHEPGQLLISQLLDRPFDAVGARNRSRPFMLASGATLELLDLSKAAVRLLGRCQQLVGAVFLLLAPDCSGEEGVE